MAPLSSAHLKKPLHAFARIAVDYPGPFITIQDRGRKRIKSYLCLFICLLLLAVHPDMTYGLDTGSFRHAFFRMKSRRGLSQEVMSNNGTNFVGASSEFKELINQLDEEKIKVSTANKRIKWHFNPLYVSYFGGMHETMIRSANKATQGTLRSADITDENQATAFAGAEEVINS